MTCVRSVSNGDSNGKCRVLEVAQHNSVTVEVDRQAEMKTTAAAAKKDVLIGRMIVYVFQAAHLNRQQSRATTVKEYGERRR